MSGGATQSNFHPEKTSGSGKDPAVLNGNSSKVILGKLPGSEKVDPLLKETKSLGRLSVSHNSEPLPKETKSSGRSSVSQSSDPLVKEPRPLERSSVAHSSDAVKESRRTFSCMYFVLLLFPALFTFCYGIAAYQMISHFSWFVCCLLKPQEVYQTLLIGSL